MARGNRRMAERAIELLDVRPSDRILEVGFGPGIAIALLAERASSGFVAGIDPSKEMIEQATRRNARRTEAGTIVLREGSAESLPFEDETFDAASSIHSLRYGTDSPRGLREIHSKLKPGGRLVLGFTPPSGQAKDGLRERLGAAAFDGARLVDVDAGFCVRGEKADAPR